MLAVRRDEEAFPVVGGFRRVFKKAQLVIRLALDLALFGGRQHHGAMRASFRSLFDMRSPGLQFRQGHQRRDGLFFRARCHFFYCRCRTCLRRRWRLLIHIESAQCGSQQASQGAGDDGGFGRRGAWWHGGLHEVDDGGHAKAKSASGQKKTKKKPPSEESGCGAAGEEQTAFGLSVLFRRRLPGAPSPARRAAGHYIMPSIPPMPPMPPMPPPMPPPALSSAISQTMQSVVSISDAIEAAFCSAERVTLAGSRTPI